MSLKILISLGVFLLLLGLGYYVLRFSGCERQYAMSTVSKTEAPPPLASPAPEPEPAPAPKPELAEAPVVELIEAEPMYAESSEIPIEYSHESAEPPPPVSKVQVPASTEVRVPVVRQEVPAPKPAPVVVLPPTPSSATFAVACPDTMRYGMDNAVVATFQVEIGGDSTRVIVTTLLEEETLSNATMAITPHVDVIEIGDLRGIESIEARLLTSSNDKFKWADPIAPKVPLSEAPMTWTWQVVPQEKRFEGVLQVALVGHYANGSTQALFGGASGKSYHVQVVSTKADWASTILAEVSGEWKWFLIVFVFPVFKWGRAKWKTLRKKKPGVVA